MQGRTISGFKLSPQQKRLWLLQQDSYAYLTQFSLIIEGTLPPEILKAALQQIINRHEILRTIFLHLSGRKIPVMVVEDSIYPLWQDIDLSNWDERQQSAKIENIFQEERCQDFDLEQGPLLHCYLLKLSPNKHLLLIGLPAICADTWTIKNLVKEISVLYSDSLKSEELCHEEIMQYLQVSEWQNQLLEDEEAEVANEYWCQQKLSATDRLKLPFENQTLKSSEFNPECIREAIAPEVTAKIATMAQKYNTSLQVVLLACWQTLIWRLTGEQDIIIGRKSDRREYEELQDVLGLFATWLPIKSHLSPDLRFFEVLELAQAAITDAEEWQDYFVPEPVDNGKVLAFPLGFEFEQLPEKHFAAGVSFSLYQQYSCIEPFKVKLTCTQHNDFLEAEFYYDVNYFSVETIQRLARQFQKLLANATENPSAVISQLEILSQSDRQQLLFEFNQTQVDYPLDKCIHQLFEEQVEKTPDNIAVVFEDQQLTYAELNARGNQLAHYLQQQGVKPEVVVGLYVERSLDFIVGLLGILKAGGAYVPLDPTLPPSGIALRLQDAQVSLLISQTSLVKSKELLTNDQEQRTIICLDTDWERIDREWDCPSGKNRADHNPTSNVKPENLVYVIYTSGSTGIPKGVAVEHQQLLNYLYSIQEILELPTGASYATVSTFAADLSNTVIFPSLCSGGCLHIVSSDRASDPQALADYFHDHPIDSLKIVPSHLKALLTCENPKQILPRQRLVLGGEACSWELIRQIQQLAPECKILNHYGPTEATIGVLTYPITNNPSATSISLKEDSKSVAKFASTVPIGRPIANNQIYLLDSEGQPVPIGVPGELHIGGAGLARGYLNRPELTAEKFINNPFVDFESGFAREQSEPNNPRAKIQNPKSSRLYKTGDLGRYLPDGTIEFLGRIDHQVKIRGFRIEPGEIEAALLKHSEVSETVVVAWEDEPGNKRLVAYVVPKHKSAPASSELRSFLLERLPEYMMPSFFVQLKALPLTPNGKVNRHMLPAPDASRPDLKQTYVAPRTPLEEKLANLWAEVLKVEQVGIHDNFFELGGDSIISIQLVARAHQVGIELAPKQLFDNQTIAELAAVADLSQGVVVEQGIVTGSVLLTPIQHWFFEQNQPDSHHWNQAILLEVREAPDPVLLQKAVQRLLEHHDALRLRFVKAESGWEQINADVNGIVPFQCLDLSLLSPDQQKPAIEETATELQASLNLAEEPLMRVALFDLGDYQRLLIVIHHLAVDGVSWRILLEDLQTAYEQLSRGEAIALPPKTTSFKHWAERLREYAQSEAVWQEQDYWLNQTSKSSPHLPISPSPHLPISPSVLPVDYTGGNNTVASERTVSVTLSVEETQALLQEVPAAYRTQINDVLLTALAQSFAQWTGEASLLVELEGHGREDIFKDVNLSRTVGWFTTHFPVLLDIGEASNPGEALKAVKEQLRGIPHRGIGYGLLRYLNENRELTEQLQALPQPEVKFNYLGQFDQVLSDSSLFAPAEESCGLNRSLRGSRNRLLVINGSIFSGQLRLDWSYSENIHRQSTIESLTQSFVEALRSLITHCQSPDAGGYTPSDFQKAKVTQKDLDQLMAQINLGS